MYTNSELIDSLIVDCNDLAKNIISGNGLAVCTLIVQMVQKLANLKKGVKNDLANREETIRILKDELRKAGKEVVDTTPEEVGKVMDEINRECANKLRGE